MGLYTEVSRWQKQDAGNSQSLPQPVSPCCMLWPNFPKCVKKRTKKKTLIFEIFLATPEVMLLVNGQFLLKVLEKLDEVIHDRGQIKWFGIAATPPRNV